MRLARPGSATHFAASLRFLSAQRRTTAAAEHFRRGFNGRR